MIIITAILSLLAIILALWYLNYKYWDRYLYKYKGPTPLPIIGNALLFTTARDILKNFNKFSHQYGNVFKFSVEFSPATLVVSDIKFLEFLLGSSKLIEKADNYKTAHRWLGLGLITSGGEKWRKRRKMLTPTFHFKILEQFIDIFDHYTNILVNKLQDSVGKKSIDIYPYSALVSQDVICASAMGTNVAAQENSDSEYTRNLNEISRIIMERGLSAYKRFEFLYQFTQDYLSEMKYLKYLHSYTYSFIKSRSQRLEEIKNGDVYESTDKKKVFLDLLLGLRDQFQLTDKDIREEVDTFMFAGLDTTTSAITFCLYCLSINPDVQKKAMEELEGIFGEDLHRVTTYKDLLEMHYLEKVIKETLRLYPSVPSFGRNLHEDVEYDGHILPKNLTIYVNAMALHRDPNIYPDPEKFDPERFNKENQSKRSPYAFIPFSAGPRNCIGKKYAMLYLKSVVSKVLKNYELLPSEPEIELDLVTENILKSENGVHLQLKNRNISYNL